MRIKIFSLLFFISFASFSQSQTLTLASNGNSPELTKEIAAYLGKKINKKINVVVYPKVTQIENGLNSNQIDLAYINTFGYILLRNKLGAKVEPLVIYGKNGIPGSYTSSFITYAGSSIKQVSDIKTKAAEINFALASPTSTSGHIIPRLYLQILGIENMEQSFKSVKFAGGHEKVIDLVAKKQAQVGAIATGFLGSQIKAGHIKSSDFRVLWTSGPIIEGPLVANSTLSSSEKLLILQVFLNLPKDNPGLWKKIKTTYPGARMSGGYIAGKDTYYNSVRRMIRHIDNLEQIMKAYFSKNY